MIVGSQVFENCVKIVDSRICTEQHFLRQGSFILLTLVLVMAERVSVVYPKTLASVAAP